MTTRLANDVRAVGTPTYCCACFGQNLGMQHVDFDASIDRGYGDDPGQLVAMDDLIMCAGCIREGAILVGMVDGTEFQTEMDSLRKRFEQERQRADSAEQYADKLELALDARPNPVIAPRKRGRPPKEDA
jgi:hypothetical protein